VFHLQEITSSELRENINVRNDTIAGVLNGMREEGRLLRRRKGKQRALWSLAEDGNPERLQSGEKPHKTGSRFSTGSQESKNLGSGLVDRKKRLVLWKTNRFPFLPTIYARAGTGSFSTGTKKSDKTKWKPR